MIAGRPATSLWTLADEVNATRFLPIAFAFLSIQAVALAERAGGDFVLIPQVFNVLCLYYVIACTIFDVFSWLLRATRNSKSRPAASLALVGYIVFTITSVIYMSYLLPISGWDFLSYWGLATIDAINTAAGEVTHSFTYDLNKHPDLLPEFLSASMKTLHADFAAQFYWHQIMVLHLLMIISTGRLLKAGLIPTGLAVLALFNPLFENHITVLGYAEAGISLGMLAFFCSLIFYLKTNMKVYIPVALITLTVLPMIKTSGWVFLLLACVSISLGAFVSKGLVVSKVIGILAISIMLPFLVVSVLEEQNIYLLKTGTRIAVPDFTLLWATISSAFLKNMSFSIIAFTMVVSIYGLIRTSTGREGRIVSLSALFLWSGAALFALLFLSTDYGMGHAHPQNDTSFSRLYVSMAGVAALTILLCVSNNLNSCN